MGTKILIIDDDDYVLSLLEHVFQGQGYEVKLCKNASMAQTIAEEYSPDCILLDVVMPNANGLDIAKHLKNWQETSKIPIIFITSSNDNITSEKAFIAGGLDFISKPLNISEVLNKVRPAVVLGKLQKLLNKFNHAYMR